MSPITIRPAAAADYPAWRPLWDGYCAHFNTTLPLEVTEATFARALDRNMPLYCFLAEQDGKAVGMMVIVLHLGTWTPDPVCYLEDLYVSEDARRRGVARAMLEFLIAAAHEQKWGRLYWQARQESVEARALYDHVARNTGWLRYEVDLKPGGGLENGEGVSAST